MENTENKGGFNLYATIDLLKIASIFGCIIIFIGYMCARWSRYTGQEIPIFLLLFIIVLIFNLHKTSNCIFAALVLCLMSRLAYIYKNYVIWQKKSMYLEPVSAGSFARYEELVRSGRILPNYFKIGIEWAIILLGVVIVCVTIYMRRNKKTFAIL